MVDAIGHVARGGHDLVVELVALLGDKELAVRRRAAHALIGLVDGRAASALADAAGDSDREVRLVAIGELGRLKAAAASPALERALGSTDAETAAARRALRFGRAGRSPLGRRAGSGAGRRADRRVRR